MFSMFLGSHSITFPGFLRTSFFWDSVYKMKNKSYEILTKGFPLCKRWIYISSFPNMKLV